jgi:predicted phage terminase large subunit-like protein
MLIVDDPHSEQDVLSGNFAVFKKAYEWFTFGARTRLMPGGAVAIVATRWHMDDLIGRVVGDMAKNEGSDQYEVFEFPAIMDSTDPDTGAPVQKALWPEFFDLPALLRTKASMPAFQWNAQYQQKPTAEEAAIVKREWWRVWENDQPPPCEYVIMALDTAAEKNNRADYTSMTTWGVFFNETEEAHQIILLHAVKDRFEFPELKKIALDAYNEWEPDAFIVEKKSSGTALYQEMRRMGLPVNEYTPVRGTSNNPNTKMARLNSVADIISSGMVWAPQTRWAEDLIEEVAAFPFGSHDDQVDGTIIALMRFRQGGFIRLASDDWDDDVPGLPAKADYY